MSTDLSLREARGIALTAQGFGARFRPRGEVRPAHLRAVADRVGAVQIDSVNVVTRSHRLPFFSRLGPYDTARLDRLRDRAGSRHVVEYWAHEASLVPCETWPLFGFRMRRAEDSWGSMQGVAARHPQIVEDVLAEVRRVGPITARGLETRLAHDVPRPREGWGWNWSVVKAALEHLFWTGRITSAGRTIRFERRYAVPEAVLPAEVVAAGPHGNHPVAEDDALAALVEISARALGVGSAQCLRDYMRLSPAQAAPAIPRLVEEGVLVPVRVQGWRRPCYLHRDAALPRRRPAVAALLSPFDSLVWQRDRTRALFGFDFRLEIYVPAAQRVHGYYVLPFLLDDALVARVDAKADRAAGVLRAQAIHWEPGAYDTDAAVRLAAELDALARFLGLAGVAVARVSGAA